MERLSKEFGFEKVEEFAQYLISRARDEKLRINIELSGDDVKMTIDPLEHHLYLCPHYGQTKE